MRKTTRRICWLLAAPASVLALSGAAASPTLPFHGEFTAGTATGDCAADFPGAWSGFWNVQIPTPGVEGSTAFVQVGIKHDGKMHAIWRMPFTMDEGTTATRTQFAAHLDPQPGDSLTAVLAADGTFTHTHTFKDFPFPGYNCDLELTGHAVR